MMADDGGKPDKEDRKPANQHGPSFPVTWCGSPNHGARRTGPIDLLLLHYTGMPTALGALERLCDPASEVSSHYLIDEDGQIFHLVSDEHRAWHAGKAFWAGETDINSRSIGVEIVHPGHPEGAAAASANTKAEPFPEKQIDAVIRLCQDICQRHAIEPTGVLAHSDVAPGRKQDPGEFFPWDKLAAEGVGHFVEPEPIGGGTFLTIGDAGEPVEALQALLRLYGYGSDVSGQFDQATADIVSAFQRHFRPERVDGIADQSTVTTLHKLLSSRP